LRFFIRPLNGTFVFLAIMDIRAELLQRSTRALTPNSISRAEQKTEINQSVLDPLGIFGFAKVEQLRSASCIDCVYDTGRG
jgi:hypothetical protein